MPKKQMQTPQQLLSNEEKKGNARTRANGEGSYRIRGNSVQFRWGDGNTLTEPVNGRSDKKLRDRLIELRGMPENYDARLKVGTFIRLWYKELWSRVENKTLEESTYVNYEFTVKIIEEEFKNDLLIDLTADDINKRVPKIMNKNVVLDENKEMKVITKPYTFGIYKKVKSMLNQMFRSAAAKKIIKPADNPMLLVEDLVDNTREAQAESAPSVDVKENYTLAEVAQLLDTLPNNKYGHAIIVNIGCSFRGQELRPLRTWDIEPDGSLINIGKASKRGLTGEYIGKTKSKNSDRLVAVPDFAQPSAKWLRDHAINDYIMPNKTGKSVTYRSYLDGYNAAMKNTGVVPLTPHKTRDTYTTLMRFEVGEDPSIIMAGTGHADRETMEGYSHVSLENKQSAADKFNALIQAELVKRHEKK
jgi:integrase